jgi:transposase
MKALYYGIDLHVKFLCYYLIVRKEDNSLVHKQGKVFISNLEPFFKTLTKDAYICVEASGMTFEFVKKVKQFVKKVLVVNPIDCKELYTSGKKTDKVDAKKLAVRLKTHIEDNDEEDGFPEVYVPEEPIIIMRQLLRTYEFLTEEIVKHKNKIKSFIKTEIVIANEKDLNSLEKILNLKGLSNISKFQIKILFEIMTEMTEKREEIKTKLIEIGKQKYLAQIIILISISGITSFGACVLIADIADISRFKNAKQLCSYLRSAQRIDSSGNTTRIGKTNKRGRKLSVKILLQALTHIKNSNEYLEDFYNRKTKGKSKSKVRIAIVRKTIVAIFYMLKNNELYRFHKENLYKNKLFNLKRSFAS